LQDSKDPARRRAPLRRVARQGALILPGSTGAGTARGVKKWVVRVKLSKILQKQSFKPVYIDVSAFRDSRRTGPKARTTNEICAKEAANCGGPQVRTRNAMRAI
jgi:hypothetical protein